MINEDEITVTKQGVGFTIGELKTQHKGLNYLNKDTIVCFFDGVDRTLDTVLKEMPVPQRSKASSDTGDDDFNAFDTYEEAIDTFRNKPEKINTFNPAELRIKDANEAGSTVDYDVVGDYIDMGRFMEGVPEAWGSMRNGNARNRRVNIITNLSQTWSVDYRNIVHRGERILRLVDALEAGGVRTRLTGITSNDCGHVEVIAKHHEEPLTINDLAVLSHPEFLRRIMFRIKEYGKTYNSGYGSSISFSNAMSRNSDLLEVLYNDEMNIFIDSNMDNKTQIDNQFDKLERLLVWEMNKPVPEVDAIRLTSSSLSFQPNGARAEDEIRQEGLEAMKNE